MRRSHYGFTWIKSITYLASTTVDALPPTCWIRKIVGWFDCHIALTSGTLHSPVYPLATFCRKPVNREGARHVLRPLHPGASSPPYPRPDGYGPVPYHLHALDLSTIHLLVALQIEAGQLSIIVSSPDRLRNVYFPERARPSWPGVAVNSR